MVATMNLNRFVRFNPGVIDVGTTIYFTSGYSITYRENGSAVVVKPLDMKKVTDEYIAQGGDKKVFSAFCEYLRAQGYVVPAERNYIRFDLGNHQLLDEAWGKLPS